MSSSHRGDNGFSYWGKKRVAKDSLLFAAIGALDELQAWLVWVSLALKGREKEALVAIKKDIGLIMGQLACFGKDKLGKDRLEFLEQETVFYQQKIGKLAAFFTPQTEKGAKINIARAVCRRAERKLVALGHHHSLDPYLLSYLNRLSLFLFYLLIFVEKQ